MNNDILVTLYLKTPHLAIELENHISLAEETPVHLRRPLDYRNFWIRLKNVVLYSTYFSYVFQTKPVSDHACRPF